MPRSPSPVGRRKSHKHFKSPGDHGEVLCRVHLGRGRPLSPSDRQVFVRDGKKEKHPLLLMREIAATTQPHGRARHCLLQSLIPGYTSSVLASPLTAPCPHKPGSSPLSSRPAGKGGSLVMLGQSGGSPAPAARQSQLPGAAQS